MTCLDEGFEGYVECVLTNVKHHIREICLNIRRLELRIAFKRGFLLAKLRVLTMKIDKDHFIFYS